MSLALRWGDDRNSTSSGFIYFDAVTSLTESYTGEVSNHPISKGGLISDHFTKNNPVFKFSGVISGVDISLSGKPVMYDETNRLPSNIRRTPSKVQVVDNSKIYTRLPVIGQFFNPAVPQIIMDTQPTEIVSKVKRQLKSLFVDGNMQCCKLYEYQNGNLLLSDIVENLVVTSLEFSKDESTEDALFCDIVLQQVTFTDIRKTTIPEDKRKLLIDSEKVSKDLESSAASEEAENPVPKSDIPETIKRRDQQRIKESIDARTYANGAVNR